MTKFLKQTSTNPFVPIRVIRVKYKNAVLFTSDSVFNLKPNLFIIEQSDRVTIPIPQRYQYTTECWLQLRLLVLLRQRNLQICCS